MCPWVSRGDSEAVLAERAPLPQVGGMVWETSRQGSWRRQLFLARPQAGQYPVRQRKGAAGRFPRGNAPAGSVSCCSPSSSCLIYSVHGAWWGVCPGPGAV